MGGDKLRRRVLLFLYGTPNMVGAAFGLVGVGLFFTGVIGPYWYLIVLGLYAIGYRITPRTPSYDFHIKHHLSTDEIRNELDSLLGTIRNRVAVEIYNKVENIQKSIVEVLPQIAEVDAGSDHNIYVIRQTALEYLPESLENYLNLPTTFARFHPLRNGKTAKQILLEQLDLLDETMKDVVNDLLENDTQKLIVHGRFLEQRFRKDDLAL